ncbi:MAG: hypothetical protein U5K69_03775 [Balneolaceae bacterium]|nr:hypothetical protein [Balneolaceae bacterium]
MVEVTLSDSVEMQYFDHDLLITASEKGAALNSEEYTERPGKNAQAYT